MEQFEIIAGTYEEFLLGYKFLLNSKTLVQSFASHDHSSSIRSVATSDYYLASGATDDRIIVYDLKTRKEHCMLTHHSSTVNCIQFTNNHSHIISGSADGVLAIVRVGNWQLEKLWEKPHNGKPILDIAVHPSGKLALTLGTDASLRTWNLVKGRQAYVINLNSKSKDARSLEKIIWAEDEVRFILYGGKYTEIWSIEVGGVLKIMEHDSKVCSCIWYNDKQIIVGYENGELARINVETDSLVTHEAHQSRVKVIAKYKKWIVSASSSGEIKVWNKHFEEHASVNSGCRITCMIIASILSPQKEEKDDTFLEIKNEPVENSVQTGRVVVVEMEDRDEEKETKKNKKHRKKIINQDEDDTLPQKLTDDRSNPHEEVQNIRQRNKKQKQTSEQDVTEIPIEDKLTKTHRDTYIREVKESNSKVHKKEKKKKRKHVDQEENIEETVIHNFDMSKKKNKMKRNKKY